ncbi:MAG: DUF2817 domain-containing protein [Lentisphaerae bacterium]|nr:DUF2817 domain-containing protein [Lentisphaerota bacterium]
MNDHHFSTTYAEARRRFIDAAGAVDANVRSYGLDSASPDDLTIDVAVLGADNAPAFVVSSGVHGVEGFFGSAVQLALLERLNAPNSRKDIRYVLIHGMNPFGFAHLRRVNEDNVDLNRNFLTNTDDYSGAPDGYARLNGFLNPRSPPSRFEPFKLKALWNVWRMGLQALKEAVAGGQYEYPRGLFFGGKGPCKSTQIVQDNCDSWLAASRRLVHIDFHTGLGPFGTYKLIVTESSDSEHYSWYAEAFGSECVEPLTQPDGTAYRASGMFGQWMQSHFCMHDCRFVGAEFGTHGMMRVLDALRAENRAHHHCSESSPLYLRAKKELRERFCPDSPTWRRQVVESGLRIVDQGIQALSVLEDHA